MAASTGQVLFYVKAKRLTGIIISNLHSSTCLFTSRTVRIHTRSVFKYRHLGRLIIPVPSGCRWVIGDLYRFLSHLGFGIVSHIVVSSFITGIDNGIRDTARFRWGESWFASSRLFSLSVELEPGKHKQGDPAD
jgi:hypothetical protein